MGWTADETLLRDAGAAVQRLGGCCGLAGNWGVEKGHHDVSVAIAEHQLLPAVAALPADGVVLADGFSCRTQLDDLAGRTGLHLAELLASRLPGWELTVGVRSVRGMTQLSAITLGAVNVEADAPRALAGFWAQLLGGAVQGDADDHAFVTPREPGGLAMFFQLRTEPRPERQGQHLDLTVPWGSRREEVDRAVRLGATHRWDVLDEVPWVQWSTLTDPEGNLFCIAEHPPADWSRSEHEDGGVRRRSDRGGVGVFVRRVVGVLGVLGVGLDHGGVRQADGDHGPSRAGWRRRRCRRGPRPPPCTMARPRPVLPLGPVPRRVAADEPLEHRRLQLGGDARAVVDHLEDRRRRPRRAAGWSPSSRAGCGCGRWPAGWRGPGAAGRRRRRPGRRPGAGRSASGGPGRRRGRR